MKHQSRAVLSLLLAMLVIMAGAQVNAGTQAAFTDTATIDNVTFASGSVNLQVAHDGENCNTNNFDLESVSGIIAATGGKPGTVATGYACIKNIGTLDSTMTIGGAVSETYVGTLTSPPTTDLKNALILRMWLPTDITANCEAGLTASGSPPTPDISGTQFYSGTVGNSIPTTSVGALNAGATDKVCMSIVLPDWKSGPDAESNGTYQDAKVDVDFTLTLQNS